MFSTLFLSLSTFEAFVSGSQLSARKATSMLDRQGVDFKNELLFQHGINFNELPAWQRRGSGLYWERYEKVGYNPIEKIEVITTRRRIKIDRELPMKGEYRDFIRQITEGVLSDR
jgi:tRNA(His) guanylyltransferase